MFEQLSNFQAGLAKLGLKEPNRPNW